LKEEKYVVVLNQRVDHVWFKDNNIAFKISYENFNVHKMTYTFDNEDDAALFKLTFSELLYQQGDDAEDIAKWDDICNSGVFDI